MANYSGGSISVFKLNTDGSIDKKIYDESYPCGSKVDSDRQSGSHPHQVVLFKNFAYVVDLGSDQIFFYRVVNNSSGELQIQTPAGFQTYVGPGYGPRHIAIDAKRSRAYLINELKMILSVFNVDPVTGSLVRMKDLEYQIPSADPKTTQLGSEIEIHPNGEFLYVSHRGNGAIVVFQIITADNGYIKQIQAEQTKGTWPRHFAISPCGSYLASVDQCLNLMEVFKIDQNGKVGIKTQQQCGKSPTVITWVK